MSDKEEKPPSISFLAHCWNNSSALMYLSTIPEKIKGLDETIGILEQEYENEQLQQITE